MGECTSGRKSSGWVPGLERLIVTVQNWLIEDSKEGGAVSGTTTSTHNKKERKKERKRKKSNLK